jgi:hypothetical protein
MSTEWNNSWKFTKKYKHYLNLISRIEFEEDRATLRKEIEESQHETNPKGWIQERSWLLRSLDNHNLNLGARNANRKVWYDITKRPIR